MQDTKIYTALALAGTIPFIAAALLPLLGHDALPYVGPLDEMVASYGLAIVCFLAGAHWGTYLSGRSADSLNLFVISNVIFLAVWFAYLGASIKSAIGIQIFAFLTLLFIDMRLRSHDVISATYLRVRTVATLIAVVSLLIVIAQ
ncbi:MAG: DUF3429 domain-containing protein [Gammaproteobacteria bacterium]|jgi:hypothetical protein|nr:DUF3429 domain-containing protein [Gammaproteobacteria bacterium]